MTLQQIDQRLSLYSDYLKYKLGIGYVHMRTPPLAMGSYKPPIEHFDIYENRFKMSFDEWLYEKGHLTLIDYSPQKLVSMGGMNFLESQRDGFTYHFMVPPPNSI